MERETGWLERLRGASASAPRFRIGEEIGRAGATVSFRAWDESLARAIVVKTVDPARAAVGRLGPAEEELIAEAAATGALSHPGVLPVHELALDGAGRPYFVTSLVQGASWRDVVVRVARGVEGATLGRAIEALRATCDTLAHAHSRGVTHGTLTPASVIVAGQGETYVTGWGHALDARSGDDVEAVGALLHALLSGRFDAAPDAAKLPASAPRELSAICRKALATDAAACYASMADLSADLRAWHEQRVVRAHRTGAVAEMLKWIARNRLAAVLFVAALVAAGAALAAADEVAQRKNRELSTARDVIAGRLADLERLKAVKTVRELAASADALWPIGSAQLPAMRRWRDEAQQRVDEQRLHRARLADLELQSTRAADGSPSFADPLAAWWHESLTQLMADLDALAADAPLKVGTIAEMSRRIAASESLESRSLEEPRGDWEAAAKRIAADPRFAGVEPPPQLGLVPLGPDPDSKLEEFWQLETGDRPQRDEKSGHVVVTGSMGLVLVLLPGGTLRFVDSAGYPGLPDYVASAAPSKASRDVTLEPFFVAKFEMTQGQWLHVTGANPSGHAPSGSTCPRHHDLRHPVEMISFGTATAILRRFDLALPTFAQWNWADRGGQKTAFWTGDEPRSLQGAANVADVQFRSAFGDQRVDAESWDDGCFCTAPVGSFRANQYGLHDTLGNVEEFCSEPPYEHDEVDFAPGDGRRRPRKAGPVDGTALVQGGSYMRPAKCCTCAELVVYFDCRVTGDSLGIRPVRALARTGRRE